MYRDGNTKQVLDKTNTFQYPNDMSVPAHLRELATPRAHAPGLGTGWEGIDRTLGMGLPRHGVHEWLGVASGDGPDRRGEWTPALTLLTHLAAMAHGEARGQSRPSTIAWIGKAVWTHPGAIAGYAGLVDASIWVDAGTPQERAWAAELALRSDACAAVIADGSRMDMSLTRRLQLAASGAEERCGATAPICLLARPPWEVGELSAATTRWLVRPVAAAGVRRVRVELLRCKVGVMSPAASESSSPSTFGQDALALVRSASSIAAEADAGRRAWTLEDLRAEATHATPVVRLVPDFPDRSVPATATTHASLRAAS